MTITPQSSDIVIIDTSKDDTIVLEINNKEVVVKHNDVGLSIDVYDVDDTETSKLQEELQIWFTE